MALRSLLLHLGPRRLCLARLFDGRNSRLLALGGLLHLAEAIHTSGSHNTAVFASIYRVAATTHFYLLVFYSAGNGVHGTARHAGRLGILMYLWVEILLHSRGIVLGLPLQRKALLNGIRLRRFGRIACPHLA